MKKIARLNKQFILLAALALVLSACGAAKSKDTAAQEHAGHSSAGQPAGQGHGEHSGHGADASSSTGTDGTRALWKLTPAQPQAGRELTIATSIQDGQGKPVEQLEVNHEKLLHLIVVSRDLSYFDHLHPANREHGSFEVTTKLPAAGEYRLFADYVPAGGSATTRSERIQVQGTAPAPQALEPDAKLTKSSGGQSVTLTTGELAAGQETTLTFHIRDAADNSPVTDLEPYLGAVGHVVILDSTAEQYLHVHPVDEKAKGPDAVFKTTFPKSGVYKIWGQFQRSGQSFIVPFVVKVP